MAHKSTENARCRPGPDTRHTGFSILLACVAILLCQPLEAAGLDYRDFTLENGLRVILVRESKAPVILSQVWYRVGAVDEVDGKTGLAHLLEHMMFQGTQEIPAGAFTRIVGRNGGEDNASTAHDYTNYYIKLASDRLALALRLEADRMRHLHLRQEALQSENQVVQEERRTRTDANPNSRFFEKFRLAAYTDKTGRLHPYGRPVIGWMRDVQTLTLKDLQDWYQRHYAPNNAILVLVGDLDLAVATQQVRHHFSGLPALPDLFHTTDGQRPKLPDFARHHEMSERRIEIIDEQATLPLWYAGYPVPTLATTGQEDVFALDVLATILGGGSSSRLYRKLVVEETVAISAYASYGGYGRSWELFTLAAVPKRAHPTDPANTPAENRTANRAALTTVEQAMQAEVARLAKEPVDERTLERAKNSMIAHHVFGRDSLHKLAADIGLLTTNGMDWRAIVEGYPQKIRSVTAADVQRVAARYLQPKRMIVGVLLP